MALAALGFLIATILSISLVQSGVNSAHRSTLGQVLAKEIAQQVNIKGSQIKTQLLKIATSRLVLDVIDGSSANLTATETSITSLIPFAERVRLIPMGQAKTDQGFPPFNYTALDLVKRVEAAETVAPEAISSEPQLEGDKWVILATPIKGRAGSLKGTLFVYLNSLSISGGITDGSSGEVRITQNVGPPSGNCYRRSRKIWISSNKYDLDQKLRDVHCGLDPVGIHQQG